MASRSETANGANRDVERAYESGRRAIYGAERDLYAIRCGPGRRACLRIGTACVLRIGTTSDTVRARTASERSGRRSICGAATIGACERCGSEPCASVTERALRALLDEFTAAVQALGATGGDADLYGRLRSTSPKAVAYSWRTRQLLGHPRGPVGASEVEFSNSGSPKYGRDR